MTEVRWKITEDRWEGPLGPESSGEQADGRGF